MSLGSLIKAYKPTLFPINASVVERIVDDLATELLRGGGAAGLNT